MDITTITSFAAAIAAGIAATCLMLLFFDFMESLQVDKDLPDELRKSLPVLFRIFAPFAANVHFIANNDVFKSTRTQVEEELQMAGYTDVITAENFLGIRILMSAFGMLLMIVMIFFGNPAAGIILAFCLYLYPGAWLKRTIKNRHTAIMKALPNVLDLLTLSVEAGKDFLTSLRDILSRRKIDALGEELGRTFHEIQLGKKRNQALRDLSRRVKQPDLSAVLSSIIQAEELGVSIGHLLKIQGDLLRNKRFVRAEKLANEAPVKILFPVVVFIFPAVIIILMVPILMQAFKIFAG